MHAPPWSSSYALHASLFSCCTVHRLVGGHENKSCQPICTLSSVFSVPILVRLLRQKRVQQLHYLIGIFSKAIILCKCLFEQSTPEFVGGLGARENQFSFPCRQQIVYNHVYPMAKPPKTESKYTRVLFLQIHNRWSSCHHIPYVRETEIWKHTGSFDDHSCSPASGMT